MKSFYLINLHKLLASAARLIVNWIKLDADVVSAMMTLTSFSYDLNVAYDSNDALITSQSVLVFSSSY